MTNEHRDEGRSPKLGPDEQDLAARVADAMKNPGVAEMMAVYGHWSAIDSVYRDVSESSVAVSSGISNSSSPIRSRS